MTISFNPGLGKAQQPLPAPERYDVWSNSFSRDIHRQKYSFDGHEDWRGTAERVVLEPLKALGRTAHKDFGGEGDVQDLIRRIYDRKFIPAGRYLYAAGRPNHQVNNCFLFRAEDSRQGWGDVVNKAINSLMTGGGIGIDYTAVRPDRYPITGSRGHATGPLSVMHMVNEAGRHVMQGGQRRSAIWAGLGWFHPDVEQFLALKDWDPRVSEIKQTDFTFPAPMELTNISVIYDDVFFGLLEGTTTNQQAHQILAERFGWYGLRPELCSQDLQAKARAVWAKNCEQAFSTAEPGFSFNALDWTESLRNACTEVVSSDDSDKCNLGTVWMQAHDTPEDFARTIDLATRFLMVGGIYSDVPLQSIRETGDRNNRIGLGLGGMHEWLMQRGERYVVNDEMRRWLEIYADASDERADTFSRRLDVARPKGVRAIAPTGTIGIIAETTTGIEPLFCKAYRRRYYKDGEWMAQFVVDGAVKRLQERGVDPAHIQDSYDISFEERVAFQADVQDYVDMAISSTSNLPSWGSEENNPSSLQQMGDTLLSYASRLRGFTCYPDGARGGQPLSRVELEEALANEGKVFEEREGECVGGVCGI